jgi:hypothetical protein
MTDELATQVALNEKRGLPSSKAIIAAVQHFLSQNWYDRDRHYALINAEDARIARLEEKISGRDAE